jgi:anti-sigma factor RsiW
MLEFVEGTLPVKTAVGVKEHVEACPECMKELEKQSSRTSVLQSLGRVNAPDQWDEIAQSIQRTKAPSRTRRYGLMTAILAALAAALVLAGAYLLGEMRERAAGAGGAPADAAGSEKASGAGR